MAADDLRECGSCGHTQPEGDYCEECGGRLAVAQKIPTDTWAHLSPNTGGFWRGLIHEPATWIALAALVFLFIWQVTHEVDVGSGMSIFLVWGLVYVVIFSWLKRSMGRPGAVWVRLAIIGAIAGCGAIPLYAPYVAAAAFAFALVSLGLSWVAKQNAKKTERDDQLRAAVEGISGERQAPALQTRAHADIPLAPTADLVSLASLLDRGLLTNEEFQKAKNRVLGDASLPQEQKPVAAASPQAAPTLSTKGCSGCGHTQPEGDFCEECGALLGVQQP
jgi:hypothetical protein